MAAIAERKTVRAAVSLVMATHNSERTVDAALASVCAQSLPPSEVVIVDDGSSDRTVDAIEGWSSRLPIKFVRLDSNLGPAHARDVGINSSEGDYIAILDSDDYLLPDHLEVLTDASEGDTDVLVSWTVRMSGSDLTVEARPSFAGKRPLAYLLEKNVGHIGMFTRAAYVGSTSGYRSGMTEDWDLLIQFARAGCSFSLAGRPTYIYRVRPSSRSRQWSTLERNLAVLRQAAWEASSPEELIYIRRGARRVLSEWRLLRSYVAPDSRSARAEALRVFPGPFGLMVRAGLMLISPDLARVVRDRFGSAANQLELESQSQDAMSVANPGLSSPNQERLSSRLGQD